MKKNKIIQLAILIIFSFLIINNTYSTEPGDKVRDFKVKNFDGKTYQLSHLKIYSAIVIMFWSTDCPYVQAYNDRINTIVSEYQANNVAFWGINSMNSESISRIKEHCDENNYIFPMLKDRDNIIANLFGATKTPEVFILDNNMVVLYHGRIDDNQAAGEVKSNDLRNALDEYLAGSEVTNKITKQFGCKIN